jgi:hypothetical protein
MHYPASFPGVLLYGCRFKSYFLTTCLWLYATFAFPQEYPRKEINIDAFVQDLFSQQDEDLDYEDLYESLFQLYTHPLNLNTATRDELAATYILSEEQLNHFFSYRTLNGRLLSIYELQAIPGFDLPTIYKLLPFVEVHDEGLQADNRTFWERIKSEPNHYLLLRYDQVLETKKGYTAPDTNSKGELNQRYSGSPGRIYARYRISHSKDFSFGFTAEKDAGEQIAWQPVTRQYGADFFSFHAMLQNKGRWKNITIGDYQIQAGQGLVVSSGFAVGKGAETITTVRRNNLGTRPYTSVLEHGFFRGVSATYGYKQFDFTAFYSQVRRDAKVITAIDTLLEAEDYIHSLQTTGFHRTASEISAKGNVAERATGANILYRHRAKNLQVGGTFLHTLYSTPLVRKPTSYNQFEFNGRQNSIAAVNYSYVWQNLNFFGEAARSQSGGTGLVTGFVSSLTPKVELAMLYRNYSKDFHSFYGNAFGENTRNINEKGIYWGIKLQPIRKVTIAGYYDKFSFPWLRYRVDAASQGYEYLGRITYKPTKSILLYAQYREESKEMNQAGNTTPIDYLMPANRKNFLFNIDYPAAKYISLKSRVQGSSFRQSNVPTFGYAIVQDITLELGRWKASSRFALFDTDDYDNRQYVYEKDVLYAFSIPAYYGRGSRKYLLLQYQVSRKLEVWARYARTDVRNQKSISSGLEEIKKPHRSEVKVQVRYRI